MTDARVTTLVVLVLLEAAISTFGVGLILLVAMRNGELPMVAGLFRALSGPFEALGMGGLIAAGFAYVALSSLKFLAAWWLWNLRLDGAVLQVVLLLASAVFWYGFAVPYGPVLGVPQLVLIVMVLASLR